jgi:hypothetical protein
MRYWLSIYMLVAILTACLRLQYATISSELEEDTPAYLGNNTNDFFSGIYIPSSIKTEVFAGAILVHRNRFMNAKTIDGWKTIRRRGIEQVLLVILFQGVNVMTRDYFDFQVGLVCRT